MPFKGVWDLRFPEGVPLVFTLDTCPSGVGADDRGCGVLNGVDIAA
jgi:hypothetical protein